MTTYDPRRSRPTPKVVPDEESAPIDGLLGPDPTPPVPRVAEDAAPPTGAVPRGDESPPVAVPVRRVERAPSALLQLSPLLVAAIVAAIVAWVVRRTRR